MLNFREINEQNATKQAQDAVQRQSEEGAAEGEEAFQKCGAKL